MFIHAKKLSVAVVILSVAVMLSSAAAQDVKTAKGQISVGIHKYKAVAGEFYLVQVTGQGFRPNVIQRPEGFHYIPEDFRKPYVYKGYIVPPKTEEESIFVSAELYNLKGTGPFAYDVKVTHVPFSDKLLLDKKDAWTATDPVYKRSGKHFKAYKISLEAGKFYRIELRRTGTGNKADPYLYLENAKGQDIDSDDDGLGFPNAMMVYMPQKTGEYRIIATTLSKATGQFSLKVKVQK